MVNKHKEFETCVDFQGYNLVGITNIWWDGSLDWSAAIQAI